MIRCDQKLEIEFSEDRQRWHTGIARGNDLFYQTRAVIGGVPTGWKAFCMPASFIGVPIWKVWKMLAEMPTPMSVERYDRFDEVLNALSKRIGA